MNRKEAIVVGVLLLTLSIGGSYAATNPNAPATSQITSVDIEVLNAAREAGIYIAPPSANFTAGFSFAPPKGFSQVNAVLLTVMWNQLSAGHNGDRFRVQLNRQSSTFGVPLVPQVTQVIILPSKDLRLGSNIIDMVVVPIDPSATTNYLLYEIRLTVEYTFLS